MKKIFNFLLCGFILLNLSFSHAEVCGDDFVVSDQVEESDREMVWAQMILRNMTLEEKIAQLFVICPEAFTGEEYTLQPSEMLLSMLEKYPVAGFRFFGQNLSSEEQFVFFISSLQETAKQRHGISLLTIAEEEGGNVSPFANKLGWPSAESLWELGADFSSEKAKEHGIHVAQYLKRLKINMNLSPVADVRITDENREMDGRMVHSDPLVVSQAVSFILKGFENENMIGVVKHFPGHGALNGSAHSGKYHINRAPEEMEYREFLPYKAVIENDAPCIMVSNLMTVRADGEYPSSMSYTVVTGLLRNGLHFENVIMTDSLRQKIVTKDFSSSKAAVLAIKAGADLIYLPDDFLSAYEGILDAVRTGEITIERIDESVLRILMMKIRFGLVQSP